ncbi:MAG: 2-hydroxychromene-2-carboxylate isomerase [Gammaproteobacteria bacterium]|nr:2-hydroxychromene-2-carboxylate isomerase [Gammaproteobacteria bacterium]MBU1441135.1 2-hydroxychromene-2-carboxylate isomerase [Gammaproteobacteria bacterium]MBU2287658.1 2-hydroxychromene-2-carboxylate isomerase [Gammaproteobacteria bacterium]MBU2408032.1 2-hydroxychromene-2-carboxylate isomerase [Gammaproteobacteria bacterium]
MSHVVDYYFSPQSPWTYLGHARFAAMAKAAGATVHVRPVDFGAVFPVSGGLPLGKRAPQRQAYRLLELARFSQHLGLPINPKPKFFPVSNEDAAKLIIAVDIADGTDAAMKLCGMVFAGVWAHEKNIADPKVLGVLVDECGLPAKRIEQSHSQAVQERYESFTQLAIDAEVFGAPSYVVDGEIFWGQDRLDFVERALQRPSTNSGA